MLVRKRQGGCELVPIGLVGSSISPEGVQHRSIETLDLPVGLGVMRGREDLGQLQRAATCLEELGRELRAVVYEDVQGALQEYTQCSQKARAQTKAVVVRRGTVFVRF
jgi:hypothetical protein